MTGNLTTTVLFYNGEERVYTANVASIEDVQQLKSVIHTAFREDAAAVLMLGETLIRIQNAIAVTFHYEGEDM